MGNRSQPQQYYLLTGLDNDTTTLLPRDDGPLRRRESGGRLSSPWLWELHAWGCASLFTVLALLCLFTALRVRAQLSRSRHAHSIAVFLGLLAAARLLVLFTDPYGAKKILPAALLQVLWDLGYPCLVAAFSLLQLSLRREAGTLPPRLGEGAASALITAHFCLVITTGVVCAVHKVTVPWLVVQLVFIGWGVFLFVCTVLGCLRLLRTLRPPSIKLLGQVDPGCEVNTIVPVGMFTDSRTMPSEEKLSHPRIHITDVDENTYSYASEGSLHPDPMPRSESVPLRCLRSASPTRANSPKHEPHEDPALVKPLIDRPRRSTISGSRGPAPIFNLEHNTAKGSLPPSYKVPSFEDVQRRRPASRLEKHLRGLSLAGSLGVALSMLRTSDVLGYDGLLASPDKPLLSWFFFQTLGRSVELMMAYTMVCASQRSTSSRYYRYRN